MKVKIIVATIVIALMALITFIIIKQTKEEPVIVSEEIIPVKILEIKVTPYDELLSYVGIITPDSIQTLGFKSPGKIEEIFVKVGDDVDTDTLLVKLDTKDLDYDLRASESVMAAAKAQYNLAVKGTSSEDLELARLTMDKADQVRLFKSQNLEDYKVLLEAGQISEKEYEGAKLETDMAQIDFSNAQLVYQKAQKGVDAETIRIYESQYNQSKINFEFKSSLIEDGQLYAQTKGSVVAIMYEENSMVPAGYPVIAIRQVEQVISIGVTNDDLKKIKIGQKVQVSAEETIESGEVTRLAEVPDQNTHLYEIEIKLSSDGTFLVGEVVDCKISIGKRTGTLIPINAVVIEESSYVFLAKEEKATKKQITVESILGDKVLIKGLDPGDQLITENISKLYEGKKIHRID